MNRIDTYARAIRRDFRWDRIKAEAASEGYCFLGTVFALTPSGKVYAPFACSNVMGCRRCKGTGKVRRSAGNAERLAAAQARLDAVDIRSLVDTHGGYAAWPSEVRAEVDALRATVKREQVTQTCTWCEGTGSHEAAKDNDWNVALERVAESHGLFIGGPDGADGCDVWVGDAESPVFADEDDDNLAEALGMAEAEARAAAKQMG